MAFLYDGFNDRIVDYREPLGIISCVIFRATSVEIRSTTNTTS